MFSGTFSTWLVGCIRKLYAVVLKYRTMNQRQHITCNIYHDRESLQSSAVVPIWVAYSRQLLYQPSGNRSSHGRSNVIQHYNATTAHQSCEEQIHRGLFRHASFFPCSAFNWNSLHCLLRYVRDLLKSLLWLHLLFHQLLVKVIHSPLLPIPYWLVTPTTLSTRDSPTLLLIGWLLGNPLYCSL